jgi:hypothetical protein
MKPNAEKQIGRQLLYVPRLSASAVDRRTILHYS